MTAPTPLPRFFTAEKPAGQFSRRHHDDVPHIASRVAYQFARGVVARRRRAAERLACTLPKSHSQHTCNGGAS